jgi:septation ring formation regulator EzrA
MVEHVTEEMERMDEIEQQLQSDQERQAALEKKQTDLAERIEKLQMDEAQAKKRYAEAQEACESLARKHSEQILDPAGFPGRCDDSFAARHQLQLNLLARLHAQMPQHVFAKSDLPPRRNR